jgi:hypothetical protein
MKRPAFQFYPADWRKDIELKACSIAARGLWIELMCLAHECEPYGHLTVNGRAMTPAQIAGQVGVPSAQCKVLLQELLDNGVARQTPEGVIFSKRMTEDERIRTVRAEGGKAGSEHGVKGAEHGSKGGRPKKETGDKKPPLQPPLEPPPSSSSSSSSSSSEIQTALHPPPYGEGFDDGGSGELNTGAVAPTAAGMLCRALRQAGIPDTNPGNLRLLTLLSAGATEAEFLTFVKAATDGTKSSPFAYVLGAVEGERTRAAKVSPTLHHGPMPEAETPRQKSIRERVDRMTGGLLRPQAQRAETNKETFDANAPRVG